MLIRKFRQSNYLYEVNILRIPRNMTNCDIFICMLLFPDAYEMICNSATLLSTSVCLAFTMGYKI